eukprot:scaffold2816_cov105-Isochrysis_galbana.AAC.4
MFIEAQIQERSERKPKPKLGTGWTRGHRARAPVAVQPADTARGTRDHLVVTKERRAHKHADKEECMNYSSRCASRAASKPTLRDMGALEFWRARVQSPNPCRLRRQRWRHPVFHNSGRLLQRCAGLRSPWRGEKRPRRPESPG